MQLLENSTVDAAMPETVEMYQHSMMRREVM
jgi:hypothetical protein